MCIYQLCVLNECDISLHASPYHIHSHSLSLPILYSISLSQIVAIRSLLIFLYSNSISKHSHNHSELRGGESEWNVIRQSQDATSIHRVNAHSYSSREPLLLSFTHSLIHSFSRSLIHSYSHTLIHSFSHSLILSFTHSLHIINIAYVTPLTVCLRMLCLRRRKERL